MTTGRLFVTRARILPLAGLLLTCLSAVAAVDPQIIHLKTDKQPCTLHLATPMGGSPQVALEQILQVKFPLGAVDLVLDNPWGLNPVALELQAADLLVDSLEMPLWSGKIRSEPGLHPAQPLYLYHLVAYGDSTGRITLREVPAPGLTEAGSTPRCWTGSLLQGPLDRDLGQLLFLSKSSGPNGEAGTLTVHARSTRAGRRPLRIRGLARELTGQLGHAEHYDAVAQQLSASQTLSVTNTGARALRVKHWLQHAGSLTAGSQVRPPRDGWCGTEMVLPESAWGRLALDEGQALAQASHQKLQPGATGSAVTLRSTTWAMQRVLRDSQCRGCAGTTVACLDLENLRPGTDDDFLQLPDQPLMMDAARHDWPAAERVILSTKGMRSNGRWRPYPWLCWMNPPLYVALELGAVEGLEVERTVRQEERPTGTVWILEIEFRNTGLTPLSFNWREVQGHLKWTLLESEPPGRKGAGGLALDIPVQVPAGDKARLRAVLGAG